MTEWKSGWLNEVRLMTKSYTNDSRRGRYPQELSFLKECREGFLKSNHTDEYNVFVIIDEPIITDKDHYLKQENFEEYASQEAYSDETRADYDEDTFKDKIHTKYVSWG